MDGECLKADSDFLMCDMISELPEEIIIRILFYLSLKEAAATSLLSPRFSNLWKHTPNLIFTCEIPNSNNPTSSWDADKCKHVELVNSVLHSHKALFLKRFKISFYVNKSAQSHVDKWLEFLFSRRVESVELDFKCWEESNKVEFLRESRICESPRTDNILAKSLKKLSLKHLKVRGEDIELFLRSLPLLEVLFIHFADFTSDFEVCGLKLERLMIFDCRGGKSVKVSAPNLEWIKYEDTSTKLSFEDVPKLVEADFHIQSSKFFEQHFASATSCFISQLQSLRICIHDKQVYLVNKFVAMPNLKKLTFTYIEVYNQALLPLTTTLLWASPRLEEFKLECIGILDGEDEAIETEVTSNVERSSHEHLKVFEFHGSCHGVGHQIVEVVKYISDNCVPLEKIVIAGPFEGVLVHGNPPHRTYEISQVQADELQSDRDVLRQGTTSRETTSPHSNAFFFNM